MVIRKYTLKYHAADYLELLLWNLLSWYTSLIWFFRASKGQWIWQLLVVLFAAMPQHAHLTRLYKTIRRVNIKRRAGNSLLWCTILARDRTSCRSNNEKHSSGKSAKGSQMNKGWTGISLAGYTKKAKARANRRSTANLSCGNGKRWWWWWWCWSTAIIFHLENNMEQW